VLSEDNIDNGDNGHNGYQARLEKEQLLKDEALKSSREKEQAAGEWKFRKKRVYHYKESELFVKSSVTNSFFFNFLNKRLKGYQRIDRRVKKREKMVPKTTPIVPIPKPGPM
jgi:hypothetical protein